MTAWYDAKRTPLWEEDDACRAARDDTREMLSDAWRRLFDEEFPGNEAAIDKADFGDCLMFLHPGGKISGFSVHGDFIEKLEDEDAAIPPSKEPMSRVADAVGETDDEEDDGELTWSIDQVQAVRDILEAFESGERVMLLCGAAGCGKTTLAQELSQQFADRGYAVQYLAPTGKAAVRISEVVGSPASTIHSKLFGRVSVDAEGRPHFHDPKELGAGRVVFIIDEASMVGRSLHHKILDNLHPEARVLYLGDQAQLPPVADKWGPDFLNPTAMLTTVHRQGQGDPILDVATNVRQGIKLPKDDIIGEDGKSYTRRGGSLQIVADWLVEHIEQKNDAVVLCYSNKARRQINNLARMKLGFLEQGPVVPGEHMIVKKNNHRIGRMNGETFVVKRVRDYPMRGGSGELGIAVLETEDGDIVTKPDLVGSDRKEFDFFEKKFRHLIDTRLWCAVDHAYALTVHASQGSEYDHVCFVIDPIMRWMIRKKRMTYEQACRVCYTAVTRAQKTVLVFDAKGR